MIVSEVLGALGSGPVRAGMLARQQREGVCIVRNCKGRLELYTLRFYLTRRHIPALWVPKINSKDKKEICTAKHGRRKVSGRVYIPSILDSEKYSKPSMRK